MGSTRPFKGRHVTRGRILSLLDTYDAPEAARMLEISLGEVEDVIRSSPKPWLLVDRKTGRQWRHRTERACYRSAQLLGLVDYDFGRVA